jgi:hypothetical protein
LSAKVALRLYWLRCRCCSRSVQRTVVQFTVTVYFDAIRTGNERAPSTALSFFTDALALFFSVEALVTADRVVVMPESPEHTDGGSQTEYWHLVAITFAFLFDCVYAVWALIFRESSVVTVSHWLWDCDWDGVRDDGSFPGSSGRVVHCCERVENCWSECMRNTKHAIVVTSF